MVWCGVVWCGVVWCGVVWCGVVLIEADAECFPYVDASFLVGLCLFVGPDPTGVMEYCALGWWVSWDSGGW